MTLGLLCLFTLFLAVVTGCSRVDRLPTTPTDGMAEFYPMAVGNRWRYGSSATKDFIRYDGTRLSKHAEGKTEVVQVRTEELHGRLYMREEIGIPDTVLAGGGVRWRRQDRKGLYEFGPPPPDAPPYSETRLLAYPLRAGAKWAMYPSSRLEVIATVEGRDVLNLPAGRFLAWRIRITGTVPRDQIVWYGRAGYLGSRGHDDTGPALYPNRQQVIYDRVDSLTRVDLVRHNR